MDITVKMVSFQNIQNVLKVKCTLTIEQIVLVLLSILMVFIVNFQLFSISEIERPSRPCLFFFLIFLNLTFLTRMIPRRSVGLLKLGSICKVFYQCLMDSSSYDMHDHNGNRLADSKERCFYEHLSILSILLLTYFHLHKKMSKIVRSLWILSRLD